MRKVSFPVLGFVSRDGPGKASSARSQEGSHRQPVLGSRNVVMQQGIILQVDGPIAGTVKDSETFALGRDESEFGQARI